LFPFWFHDFQIFVEFQEITSFQNELEWNTLISWTVHLVMDELPSQPGVNSKTTEKASMLDTASWADRAARDLVKWRLDIGRKVVHISFKFHANETNRLQLF